MANVQDTLLTGDNTDASNTDASKTDTGSSTDNGSGNVVSADDQRKALIDAGGNADEIGKLDEAGLKAKYDEHVKAKAAADKAADKGGAPEKYEPFKFEGIDLDEESTGALQKDVEELARELGLSQDKAQLLANRFVKAHQDNVAQTKATIEQWRKDARADKELGGGEGFDKNLAIAKLGMKETASPALRELLRQQGWGDHPEVIRHFFAVGQLFKNDKTETGGRRPAGDQSAQSFYANSNMNP